MPVRVPKKTKSRSTKAKTDKGGKPRVASQTGAAEMLPPEVLNALVFGYLSALKMRRHDFGSAGVSSMDIESMPTFLEEVPLDYEALDMLSEDLPIGASFAEPRKGADDDIIGDVLGCIFLAFDDVPSPITTRTTPASIMGLPKWISVGRVILSCAARKYPEFGPVARPSRLRGFYTKSLMTLAQAIRSAISKRR